MKIFLILFLWINTSYAQELEDLSSLPDDKEESNNSNKKSKLEYPLWEVGVGLIYAVAPDYPGANHSSYYKIPVPAFIYRGEIMRSEMMKGGKQGGLKGRFIQEKDYEFNISIGGALPSKSKFNPTRIGMDDLDTMVELGPAFILKLYDAERFSLKLTLPLRIALSTDFTSLSERGLVFNPILSYIHKDILIDNSFLFTAISVRFATQKLHSYFYQVNPKDVTSNRPLYGALGGYLSTSISLGLGRSFDDNKMIFLGYRQSLLGGAANEDGPLLVSKSNSSFAIGLVWWFWQSKTKGHK
ncbi:MAG: MipA/OmpV family protein [Bacteriovoracaceae bacterium]|jgi:MipA family protein|nr:MipA/OmpV family protein [Bacteriovoracaceae bacterium]